MIEDTAQEAFIKAFQNLEKFDPSRSFATWLFTIARNCFFDEWRKTRKETPMGLSEHRIGAPSPEETAHHRITLQETLELLNDSSKLVLELRIFLGLSFSEMAEITGETENSLRVRFHRVIEFLRTQAPEKDERL